MRAEAGEEISEFSLLLKAPTAELHLGTSKNPSRQVRANLTRYRTRSWADGGSDHGAEGAFSMLSARWRRSAPRAIHWRRSRRSCLGLGGRSSRRNRSRALRAGRWRSKGLSEWISAWSDEDGRRNGRVLRAAGALSCRQQ
jgi:hypothetical protein